MKFRPFKQGRQRRDVPRRSLRERISKLQGHLSKLQEKEPVTLRPIMDRHHAKICEKWPAICCSHGNAARSYGDMGRSSPGTHYISGVRGHKPRSFLAPIRRLPAELLVEVLIIAIEQYRQNCFAMTRVCRSWRAIILSMARI